MISAPLVDRIVERLEQGIASTPVLAETLGVSQSSVARALRQLVGERRVLRIGSTRGVRYARRRAVESIGSEWPLRRVDRSGDIRDLGILYSLSSNQYFLDLDADAVEAGAAIGGLSTGLPYLLQDQRPDGFLGRAVPRRYPELQLPQRVTDWSDDHYLRYLTQRGSDTVGDSILGTVAFDEYLASRRRRPTVGTDDRHVQFPRLANEVMAGGLPGSSAHGEHPKFAATIDGGGELRPVIVKFSPPVGTAAGARWSDLLIAEHVAHGVLRRAGIPACESDLLRIEDRTYLEVTRFDRAGAAGRIGVSSLLAIDTARYGALDSWIASATRLLSDGRIDAATLEQVRLASTFGALIANTDRHFGNLALFDDYTGHFQLAPIYDMLPMLFAPEHEQVIVRPFDPPDPTSETFAAWPRAGELAEGYWKALAADSRISPEFRTICRGCWQALQSDPESGSHAPANRHRRQS